MATAACSAYPARVLTRLPELVAARDWYPVIGPDATVAQAVRFIDLDAPGSAAALDARVALCIGVTEHPDDDEVGARAAQFDLTITAQHATDAAIQQVDDVDKAIARLQSAVDASPRAAMVLASVLRQTAALPLAAAIAAEAAAYSTLLAGPEFAAWLAARGTRRQVPAGEDARVALALHDEVLDVRMIRRLRLNAIDGPMRAALVDAFSLAIADPSLRIRLTGEGPCFSNGGDLREFGTTPEPATAWAVRMTQHPGWHLAQVADRASAHVHGPCVGAGVELPAFAGHVVADPATTFRLPELTMGLIPGAGGCVSIPRRIGRWRALWLMLTGATIDADTARALGLVDELAPVA